MRKNTVLNNGFYRYKKNLQKGVCAVFRCTNRRAASRSLLCSKHLKRKERFEDPVKYQYRRLRTKAKKRGVNFELTYPEFLEIVNNSGVDFSAEAKLDKEVRHYPSFDRVDNDKGYVFGNVRITTHSYNCMKYRQSMKIPYYINGFLSMDTHDDGEETPF